MPFRVTLMRVRSVPLIRRPVYPIPLPASEFTTTEGVWLSRKGRSCPRLYRSISFLEILVLVKGAIALALTVLTSTGTRSAVSFFSWAQVAREKLKQINEAILFIFKILK